MGEGARAKAKKDKEDKTEKRRKRRKGGGGGSGGGGGGGGGQMSVSRVFKYLGCVLPVVEFPGRRKTCCTLLRIMVTTATGYRYYPTTLHVPGMVSHIKGIATFLCLQKANTAAGAGTKSLFSWIYSPKPKSVPDLPRAHQSVC